MIIREVSNEYYREKYNDYKGNCSFYLSPIWCELINQIGKYKVRYFSLNKNTDCIAIMPIAQKGRKFLSMPYGDSGGILSLNGDKENSKYMFEYFERINQNNNYKISLNIKTQLKKGLVGSKTIVGVKSIITLDNNIEKMFLRLGKKDARWGVKKALNKGLKTIKTDDLKYLDEFYKLMVATRKRQGSPLFRKNYFELLIQLCKDNFHFRFVIFEQKIISGAIFFHDKGVVTYGYSGSYKEYWNFQPNNLLIWDEIMYSIKNGYKYLDLGFSPLGNRGLIKFKNSFGSVTYTQIIWEPLVSGIYRIRIDRIRQLFSVIWRKIPERISKIIDPIIIDILT